MYCIYVRVMLDDVAPCNRDGKKFTQHVLWNKLK